MLEEIEASKRLIDSHMKVASELIRDYHGEFYRDGVEPTDSMPENHAFEWISLITPKVIWDNPVVNVSSRRSGTDKATIKKLQHALNRWTKDEDLWRTLQRVWYDMAFSYGVTRCTLEESDIYPGADGLKPLRPCIKRLPPKRFRVDPRADHISEARWMGHLWVRDKNDLMSDDRYNREAIMDIAADADLDMAGADKDAPHRKEIVGYEIWVPEKEYEGASADDGYHGTIYTLATANNHATGKSAEPLWIRDPRPFYGPVTGPYALWGVYLVPGQVLPLSPLAATYKQVKELNTHAAAAARSAARTKKFIGYDPAMAEAGKAVKSAEDGTVVAVPGLKEGAVQELEFGGVGEGQYGYLALLRDRVDRSTGINESSRGNAEKNTTATAVAAASQGMSDRIALIQSLFTDNTAGVLYSAGWYMWHSEFVVFPLGDEAVPDVAPRPKYLPPEAEAETVAMDTGMDESLVKAALSWSPKIMWAGGIEDGFYDELDLQIEPYSMQRVDDSVLQRRALDVFDLVTRAAPTMIQSPHIDWQELLDQVGEPMNMKGLGDKIKMPMLEQLWSMQFGAMQQPQQQQAQQQSQIEAQAAQAAMMQQGAPMAPAMDQAQQIGSELGQAMNLA